MSLTNVNCPLAEDQGYEEPQFAQYQVTYRQTRHELPDVLDPKDLMGADYPSETFLVLQKNEIPKYGEYRTRRLVLAAYDALVTGGMRLRTEGYR
jgi:hypothetical protein